MLPPDQLAPRLILQVECITTYLRTFPTVGATACSNKTSLAITTIANAQRTMHKSFERHIHSLAKLPNFVCRQFPGKHKLRKTGILKETGFFKRPYVALSRGNRRKLHFQQCHILHDKGVNTYAVKFPDKFFDTGQLLIVDNRIDGYINLDTEPVGIFNHPPYIRYGIGRLLTRTMA